MTAQQLNRKFERLAEQQNKRVYMSKAKTAYSNFCPLDSKNGRYTSARTARAWTAYYYANK